jgi:hypothetical protein
MITFELRKSKNKLKKYDAFFSDDEGNYKKVSFGAIRPNGEPYEDLTMHGDEKRKQRYIKRHQKNEDFENFLTSGSLSRYLLWNKRTLAESIKDFKKRFNLA